MSAPTSVIGGTLFVDGAEVELFRDNLCLDVRLKQIDPDRLETINVFIGDTLVATLPSQVA